MSDELEDFFESETVEPEAKVEEPAPEPEAEEPEAEPEPEGEPEEEQESSPTEPEEKAEKNPDKVPYAALKDEREKRQRYERELELIRKETQQYQQELERYRQPQPTQEEPGEYPTLESVNYDEAAYQKAVRAYEQRTRQADIQAAIEQYRQQQEQEQWRQKAEKLVSDIRSVDPSLEFVIKSDAFPGSQTLINSAMSMENGHEVLAHIAKDEALQQKLHGMPEWQHALEVGKLSARLERAKEVKKPEPPKVPKSLTNIRATGGNKQPAIEIPDPLETTFNR